MAMLEAQERNIDLFKRALSPSLRERYFAVAENNCKSTKRLEQEIIDGIDDTCVNTKKSAFGRRICTVANGAGDNLKKAGEHVARFANQLGRSINTGLTLTIGPKGTAKVVHTTAKVCDSVLFVAGVGGQTFTKVQAWESGKGGSPIDAYKEALIWVPPEYAAKTISDGAGKRLNISPEVNSIITKTTEAGMNEWYYTQKGYPPNVCHLASIGLALCGFGGLCLADYVERLDKQKHISEPIQEGFSGVGLPGEDSILDPTPSDVVLGVPCLVDQGDPSPIKYDIENPGDKCRIEDLECARKIAVEHRKFRRTIIASNSADSKKDSQEFMEATRALMEIETAIDDESNGRGDPTRLQQLNESLNRTVAAILKLRDKYDFLVNSQGPGKAMVKVSKNFLYAGIALGLVFAGIAIAGAAGIAAAICVGLFNLALGVGLSRIQNLAFTRAQEGGREDTPWRNFSNAMLNTLGDEYPYMLVSNEALAHVIIPGVAGGDTSLVSARAQRAIHGFWSVQTLEEYYDRQRTESGEISTRFVHILRKCSYQIAKAGQLGYLGASVADTLAPGAIPKLWK